MVNINKFKGKIVECNLNIGQLAHAIHVDRATLYRKINGNGVSFTVKEIDLIANVLSLDCEEMNKIFFSQFFA